MSKDFKRPEDREYKGYDNVQSSYDPYVQSNSQPRSDAPRHRSNYNNNRNFDRPDRVDAVQPQLPEPAETLDSSELRLKTAEEIMGVTEGYGIPNTSGLSKRENIFLILKHISDNNLYKIASEGVLEILSEGYGFLRSLDANYAPCHDDVYVSQQQIKRWGFKTGDIVKGYVRGPRPKEKYFSLMSATMVNGRDVNEHRKVVPFDNLTPLYPKESLKLEVDGIKDVSNRVINLVAPIGKGQRALIVAPPRTGKTILLQNIAVALNANHPEVHLIVLLIDERPEEVTDMMRTIKGEIVSSTFDENVSRHVALAEIVIERAKRLVEQGKDVVILLDSITRLARAYNAVMPSSGKVLSGGVDSNALQPPKRFFGAARNVENGGSLTIIATALVETGSRMDDVIFEEFKGTGNCEIVLDRKLSDKRIFPAIDIIKSGTRKEEEMIAPNILAKMWILRRITSGMTSIEAMEFLHKKLKETKNNADFFDSMNS